MSGEIENLSSTKISKRIYYLSVYTNQGFRGYIERCINPTDIIYAFLEIIRTGGISVIHLNQHHVSTIRGQIRIKVYSQRFFSAFVLGTVKEIFTGIFSGSFIVNCQTGVRPIIIIVILIKIHIKIKRIEFLVVSSRLIITHINNRSLNRPKEIPRMHIQKIIVLHFIDKAKIYRIYFFFTFNFSQTGQQAFQIKFYTRERTLLSTGCIQLLHFRTRCRYIYTYIIYIHVSSIC